MQSTEIVINIWFWVDIGTSLCYAWSIKPYNINGTDTEKLAILHNLAETDYITVTQRKLPAAFITVFDNIEMDSSIFLSQVQNQFEQNIDYFITEAENELPFIKQYINEKVTAIKPKISQAPLYTSTLIMENEIGMAKPFTTIENKNWYKAECIRLKI